MGFTVYTPYLIVSKPISVLQQRVYYVVIREI